jgi:uncharacterized protein YbcI
MSEGDADETCSSEPLPYRTILPMRSSNGKPTEWHSRAIPNNFCVSRDSSSCPTPHQRLTQRSNSPSADADTYDHQMATDDSAARRTVPPGRHVVTTPAPTIPKELAQIALSLQTERTGHSPKAVTVVASDETVVVTLHEALTPAEKLLARSVAGAAQVEGYHRALFAVSCDQLRAEIQRLTGRKVKESAVVVEPATGAIVHAFTSGTIVQIFQLEPHAPVTPSA